MYQSQSSQAATPNSAKSFNGGTKSKLGKIRLGDVWDEREELFGIGDSDEDDDGPAASNAKASPANRRDSEASSVPGHNLGPKIVITSS